MNKPIYSVLAKINGSWIQVCNATANYREARDYAYQYFNEYKKTRSVKVVKSSFVQEDVDSLVAFKVRVVFNNTLHCFYTRKDFYNFVSERLADRDHFEVHVFSD